MSETKTRSRQLLDKVYDHLETIDVTKLSMDELKDFLEVVQKGQFLESFGQMPQYGFGFGGANWPVCSTNAVDTEDGKGAVE